jgi:hypothetical protein
MPAWRINLNTTSTSTLFNTASAPVHTAPTRYTPHRFHLTLRPKYAMIHIENWYIQYTNYTTFYTTLIEEEGTRSSRLDSRR